MQDTLQETATRSHSNGFSVEHSMSASRGGDGPHVRRAVLPNIDLLPPARDAAFDLARRIEKEERSSALYKHSEIKVLDDGKWKLGDEELFISRGAFATFANGLSVTSAGSYLANVDPDLRAYNVRHLLNKAPDNVRKFAMRNSPAGGREIYAVMGQDYPLVGAIQTLDQIARRAPTDARAEWRYDPNTTRVQFKELLQNKINPSPERALADAFQVGRSWSMRDNGATSISIALLTFRMLCSNMLVWAETKNQPVRIVHRGLVENVTRRLLEGFDDVTDMVRTFTYRWSGMREQRALAAPTLDHAVRALEYMVSQRLLPIPKLDAAVPLAGMAMAWTEEPGGTAADIINAVTRYARDMTTDASQHFLPDELEVAAGDLMHLSASRWRQIEQHSV